MFSTGFTFLYDKAHEVTPEDTVPHSWFNHTDEEYQRAPIRFRVRPRFESMKEEVVGGGHLTQGHWHKLVLLKAQKYMKSKKVRNITAVRVSYMSGGPREGDQITQQHLIAVILYCDFSALCTAFSATYRRDGVFESVESVVERHSHFWWLGRFLKEIVHYFGTDGEPENERCERGPFFCGVNCVLTVNLGALRLYGPCSTSTNREVAFNCAKSNGIILKVNNDGTHYSPRTRFFDCSWISNYFEEAERLFMAEKYPLRIVSVVIMRSAKNYRNMFRPFFFLKTLLSGWRMSGPLQVQAQDCAFLEQLLSPKSNAIDEFDPYLRNTVELFLISTRVFTINLWCIDEMNSDLSSLILERLQRDIEYKEVIGNPGINRVTPSVFCNFDEIEKLVIHSTSRRGKFSYPFNIAALISELESQCNNLSDEFTLIIKARVKPETRYKSIPSDIVTLKQRMEDNGISKSDLEKFQEEIDREKYDFDAIGDDIGHGIENSMLAESAREKMEIGEDVFEILTTILEGNEAITPENPDDDDYSSDEEVAAPLKEKAFPERSWLTEVWKQGELNLVRGWSSLSWNNTKSHSFTASKCNRGNSTFRLPAGRRLGH